MNLPESRWQVGEEDDDDDDDDDDNDDDYDDDEAIRIQMTSW